MASKKATQREAEIDRWRDLGRYEAAKLTARLAVAAREEEARS